MKKLYTLFVFLLLVFGTIDFGYAQNFNRNSNEESQDIKGLSIHPNPVVQGKLFIITRQNLAKKIEIYNVLGKPILETTVFGKELNISKLKSGVYILKVIENNISATRKLVVR